MYKARLCVHRDLQCHTSRGLMAIAAVLDLKAHQYETINAFTNNPLDSLYMRFSRGI